jgi:hypothetical protein
MAAEYFRHKLDVPFPANQRIVHRENSDFSFGALITGAVNGDVRLQFLHLKRQDFIAALFDIRVV